jgi:hypothetical protein
LDDDGAAYRKCNDARIRRTRTGAKIQVGGHESVGGVRRDGSEEAKRNQAEPALHKRISMNRIPIYT